jgi:leucyl aminopeptidase
MEDHTVVELLPCRDISDNSYDGVVVVSHDVASTVNLLPSLNTVLKRQMELDTNAFQVENVALIQVDTQIIPSGRLILSPTGVVNRDFDDVRRYVDASDAGIKKAIKTGIKKILLVVVPHPDYPNARLASVLGALQTLYVPLEIREAFGNRKQKAQLLGVLFPKDDTNAENALKIARGIEAGRYVARDIAGSDPERMAPPKVSDYVKQAFKDSSVVKVDVIDNQDTIKKEYPFTHAVNRGSNVVPRYQARIIKLTYQGEGPVEETLMFVGKGVTLDTGGLDVKTNGHMVGMSRDKSGAAAVAGFFKTLEILRPKNIKVVGTMSVVRNGIGPESYSCDEILTARSGRRVRVVNTDAEGRMVMLDPLCEMKERALNEVNPHIFTIATLTGHAVLTVGEGYSIAMDNGPAHRNETGVKLREASEMVGDMVEVSILRREDYDYHRGKSEYEDLRQSGTGSSATTPRGHMRPCAFLIMGSGLDEHGIDSKNPLKYTHIDMAGAEGPEFPSVPWGSPVAALAARYILPRVK